MDVAPWVSLADTVRCFSIQAGISDEMGTVTILKLCFFPTVNVMQELQFF